VRKQTSRNSRQPHGGRPRLSARRMLGLLATERREQNRMYPCMDPQCVSYEYIQGRSTQVLSEKCFSSTPSGRNRDAHTPTACRLRVVLRNLHPTTHDQTPLPRTAPLLRRGTETGRRDDFPVQSLPARSPPLRYRNSSNSRAHNVFGRVSPKSARSTDTAARPKGPCRNRAQRHFSSAERLRLQRASPTLGLRAGEENRAQGRFSGAVRS